MRINSKGPFLFMHICTEPDRQIQFQPWICIIITTNICSVGERCNTYSLRTISKEGDSPRRQWELPKRPQERKGANKGKKQMSNESAPCIWKALVGFVSWDKVNMPSKTDECWAVFLFSFSNPRRVHSQVATEGSLNTLGRCKKGRHGTWLQEAEQSGTDASFH